MFDNFDNTEWTEFSYVRNQVFNPWIKQAHICPSQTDLSDSQVGMSEIEWWANQHSCLYLVPTFIWSVTKCDKHWDETPNVIGSHLCGIHKKWPVSGYEKECLTFSVWLGLEVPKNWNLSDWMPNLNTKRSCRKLSLYVSGNFIVILWSFTVDWASSASLLLDKKPNLDFLAARTASAEIGPVSLK